MLKYSLKRISLAIIVFLLVSFCSYTVMFLAPGDPVYAMYGSDISPEQYQKYYHSLSLDKPLLLRFGNWFINIFRGDFGYSTIYRMDVKQLIADRLPITMYIGVLSLIITAIFGVLFGVIAAVKRALWQDSVITVLANLGSTVPLFWLGAMGVYVFSIKLGWLPASGYTSPFKDFGLSLRQIILPVTSLAFCQVASITRMTRSTILEVLNSDYVRTARSKGLEERQVLWSHVIPNAISPVITMIGILFRLVVGGSVAIEKIFNVPGMGQLMINSLLKKDVNPMQACIVVICAAVLVVTLVVDLINAKVDPRIRVQ